MSVSRLRKKKTAGKDDESRNEALRDAMPDSEPPTAIKTIKRRRSRPDSD